MTAAVLLDAAHRAGGAFDDRDACPRVLRGPGHDDAGHGATPGRWSSAWPWRSWRSGRTGCRGWRSRSQPAPGRGSVLLVSLWRRHRTLDVRSLAVTFSRSLVAALVAGAIAFGMLMVLDRTLPADSGKLAVLGRAVIAGGISALGYLAMSLVLRAPSSLRSSAWPRISCGARAPHDRRAGRDSARSGRAPRGPAGVGRIRGVRPRPGLTQLGAWARAKTPPTGWRVERVVADGSRQPRRHTAAHPRPATAALADGVRPRGRWDRSTSPGSRRSRPSCGAWGGPIGSPTSWSSRKSGQRIAHRPLAQRGTGRTMSRTPEPTSSTSRGSRRLWSDLRSKWQQYVNKARRSGVTVEDVGADGLDDFYRIYVQTPSGQASSAARDRPTAMCSRRSTMRSPAGCSPARLADGTPGRP